VSRYLSWLAYVRCCPLRVKSLCTLTGCGLCIWILLSDGTIAAKHGPCWVFAQLGVCAAFAALCASACCMRSCHTARISASCRAVSPCRRRSTILYQGWLTSCFRSQPCPEAKKLDNRANAVVTCLDCHHQHREADLKRRSRVSAAVLQAPVQMTTGLGLSVLLSAPAYGAAARRAVHTQCQPHGA